MDPYKCYVSCSVLATTSKSFVKYVRFIILACPGVRLSLWSEPEK